MIIINHFTEPVQYWVYNSDDHSHIIALTSGHLAEGICRNFDAPDNATGQYTIEFWRNDVQVASATITNCQKLSLLIDESTQVC